MHVEASTSATAYVAALSALATDVLPCAAGADLADLPVSASAHRWQSPNAPLPDRTTPASRHHFALGSAGPRGGKPEAPEP